MRAIMHISLTPQIEASIKSKVDSGWYNNASEVVRDALRFMETHEEWVNSMKTMQLKQQLNAGVQQLDNGEGKVIQSTDQLDAVFDQLFDQTLEGAEKDIDQ